MAGSVTLELKDDQELASVFSDSASSNLNTNEYLLAVFLKGLRASSAQKEPEWSEQYLQNEEKAKQVLAGGSTKKGGAHAIRSAGAQSMVFSRTEPLFTAQQWSKTIYQRSPFVGKKPSGMTKQKISFDQFMQTASKSIRNGGFRMGQPKNVRVESISATEIAFSPVSE